jgi:hypothetical protein
MFTPRMTHDQREQTILNDLEASFPHFAGRELSWAKVPEGHDPPDFLGHGAGGSVGLELIEWLAGDQMGPAKERESKRDRIRHVLKDNWEAEYRPESFNLAVAVPDWGQRMTSPDEIAVRQEFFACSEKVDRTWHTHPEWGACVRSHRIDKAEYPTMAKYIQAIRFIQGRPHGFCWIDVEEDAGAYDPTVPIETLEQAIEKKLDLYSTQEKQAQLKARGLTEFYLLVHGGFNAFRYNTPSHPLSLEEIARRGAGFYADHPFRRTFSRVWFFDSLDSADEINQLLGYPTEYGRVRWLARLWPEFSVHPGSFPG